MRIRNLSADAALSSLRSGPGGLTPGEAARRLGKFGPNALTRPGSPREAASPYLPWIDWT